MATVLIQEVPVVKKQLNGYVGFNNLPSQIHRSYINKGFQFTLMVVGEPGLGKKTFVNTLFNTTIIPPGMEEPPSEEFVPKKPIQIHDHVHDLEENGVKLRLTVVEAVGFGEALNNEDACRPILENIESRFDSFLEREFRVKRDNTKDTRVHACLYFINPSGHSLSALDIDFMKRLSPRVNIIPVIAKADTLTEEDLSAFKSRILEDLNIHRIEVFHPSTHPNDDAETQKESAEMIGKIPFAVVGSSDTFDVNGKKIRGRQYPWGTINIENEDHCDFIKLRQLLIRSYMEELREHTTMVLYETYRTFKMKQSGGVTGLVASGGDTGTMARLEQSKIAHDQKMSKMEAEMRAVFQQKVAEKEAKLKQSESELYARHKEMKEQLEKQRADIEDRLRRIEGRPSTPGSESSRSWKKASIFKSKE